MTTNDSANAQLVDEMLYAAARSLVLEGQAKFMDLDMVRVAFGSAEAPVDERELIASMLRLCESGKLVPFVEGVIIRALLRGPRRAQAKPTSVAGQVVAALGPGNRIPADKMLALVRKRNVLVSFTVPAQPEEDEFN